MPRWRNYGPLLGKVNLGKLVLFRGLSFGPWLPIPSTCLGCSCPMLIRLFGHLPLQEWRAERDVDRGKCLQGQTAAATPCPRLVKRLPWSFTRLYCNYCTPDFKQLFFNQRSHEQTAGNYHLGFLTSISDLVNELGLGLFIIAFTTWCSVEFLNIVTKIRVWLHHLHPSRALIKAGTARQNFLLACN